MSLTEVLTSAEDIWAGAAKLNIKDLVRRFWKDLNLPTVFQSVSASRPLGLGNLFIKQICYTDIN